MLWLKWFPVLSTLAAFYVDCICSFAFYRYWDTLVAIVKSGSINKTYFVQLLTNAQLLPILNFYVLLGFSGIMLFGLFIIFVAKTSGNDLRFHYHYFQHFMVIRVFYLVIIGMHWTKNQIKNNLFTDILCSVTALVNVILSVLKISNVSASPVPTSSSSGSYDPSLLGGNQTLIARGWYLAQVAKKMAVVDPD
ncbi:hypothetical protein BGX26_009537 [Mortierella sp. AD094]|nr:hypothetical protein BGX26_009537 [Mortierella sp. AD094]